MLKHDLCVFYIVVKKLIYMFLRRNQQFQAFLKLAFIFYPIFSPELYIMDTSRRNALYKLSAFLNF